MENAQTRSAIMREVKSTNTAPERIVRSMAHKLGFRFRLHRKDLPGRPDLVFPGKRKVIFVHGCFWHGHGCARGSRVPVNNQDYWLRKIERNRRRDRRNVRLLRMLGWEIKVIWECTLKRPRTVLNQLDIYLGG